MDITFEEGAVAGKPLTPELAKKYFAVVKGLVAGAKFVAALTKSTDDDAVIEKVEKVLAFIEPHLDNPLLYEVLNTVIGLFYKGDVAQAFDVAKDFATK